MELAEAVKVLYPRVKIVLTSGYARAGLLSTHEQDYLYTAKSYRIETILKLLQS